MMLTRLSTFPSLWRDVDELLRDVAFPQTYAGQAQDSFPVTDIVETDRAFELRLDMPGVKADAIEVKVQGQELTIAAERPQEALAAEQSWLRRERTFGRFARTFTLPSGVDGARLDAAYRHGVLVVTLPKKEEVQPRSVKVRVEA